MRFESRFISALCGLLVALAALAALSAPSASRAAGSLPAGCNLVHGIIVCADAGTGPDGTAPIPPGCTSVAGVIVCDDGSTGDGSVCVTASDGTRSCLTGGGSWGGGGQPGPSLGTGLGSVPSLPQQSGGTGWLSRLTGWIAYAFHELFAAIVGFFKDLVTYTLATVLGVVALAISLIPVPDWIASTNMGSMLGQAGPIAGFFMVKLQIPASLGLIGAGYVFRLGRKFVTLFQW